jgi:hypothetical protein
MGVARIGRIRHKDGGADVRIIRQTTPDKAGEENWCGQIVKSARTIAEQGSPTSELVGFFVIGLFSDGAYSMGLRWDHDRSPIPRSLMPAYVEELIRQDLISRPDAERTACNVVNRANGYGDDDGA